MWTVSVTPLLSIYLSIYDYDLWIVWSKSFGISDRKANALDCHSDIPGHFHAKNLSGRSAWGSRAPWGGLKCLVRSKETHGETVSGNTCPQQSHFKSLLNKRPVSRPPAGELRKNGSDSTGIEEKAHRDDLWPFLPVFGALYECIFNFF